MTDNNLENHELKTLDGIEKLEKLEYLDVSRNHLKNLKPAAQCIGLRALTVINNELISLNGVENLTNLLVLDVRGNKIKSLQGIKKLKKLESLDVSDNRLTELKLVKSLTQLKQLDVSYNRIQKLADLSKMKDLKILDLSHNLLTEKEIRKKTPKKFQSGGKKKKGWLRDQIQYQKLDYKIRLISPASMKKITTKTTRIEGKTIPNARVTLYSGKYETYLGTARADKNGRFVMSKLNLKKWSGEAEFVIMLKSQETGVWETVRRKNVFNIKK